MSQINLRIDKEVKDSAEKTLKAMGLTMSSAITMFLTAVIREQRIPFEITADPFYSGENIRYLRKLQDDIESGRVVLTERSFAETGSAAE